MQTLRTAVIGAGYLGRFHAQKYAAEAAAGQGCVLVGVVDPRPEAREALARELGTTAYADHRELLGKVDAVSVVTTTPAHFAISRDFLQAGAHVLVAGSAVYGARDRAAAIRDIAAARRPSATSA